MAPTLQPLVCRAGLHDKHLGVVHHTLPARTWYATFVHLHRALCVRGACQSRMLLRPEQQNVRPSSYVQSLAVAPDSALGAPAGFRTATERGSGTVGRLAAYGQLLLAAGTWLSTSSPTSDTGRAASGDISGRPDGSGYE